MDDFDFSTLDIDFSEDLSSQDIESKVDKGVDIENLLHAIGKYRSEVEFLKELKKKRIAPIDAKIAKLNSNEEYLKNLILELMPVHFGKKNTVDFPGVGKLSKRVKKGKWVVHDFDKFLAQVEKRNLDEDVIKVEKKVVAKFLPSVIAEMMKDLKEDELEGVVFEEPENAHSLAISIYEAEEKVDDEDYDF